MAHGLILPGVQHGLFGGTRPGSNTQWRLNRRHRLTENIVSCIVFGPPFGAFGRELITGMPLLAREGSPTSGISDSGPAGSYTSGASLSTEAYNPAIFALGDLTVAWCGQVDTLTGGSYIGGTIEAFGNGAANTPYCLSFEDGGYFSLNRANGGGFRVWQQTTQMAVAGQRLIGGVSQNSGIQNTPVFYVNGRRDTASATNLWGGGGSGLATGNTHWWTSGNFPNGGTSSRSFKSNIYLVASRVWSDDDHLEFGRRPWVIFEESPLHFFMGRGTASTAFFANASFNIQALLLSGGGVVRVSAGSSFEIEPASSVSGESVVSVGAGGQTPIQTIGASGESIVPVTTAGSASVHQLATTSEVVTPVGITAISTIRDIETQGASTSPVTATGTATHRPISTDGAANVHVEAAGSVTTQPSSVVAAALAAIAATAGVNLNSIGLAGANSIGLTAAGVAAVSSLPMSIVVEVAGSTVNFIMSLSDNPDAIASIGTIRIDASGNLIDFDANPLATAASTISVVAEVIDGGDSAETLADVRISVTLSFLDDDDYQTMANLSAFVVGSSGQRRAIVPADKRTITLDPINRRITMSYSSRSITVI